jgi:hypothetical protein
MRVNEREERKSVPYIVSQRLALESEREDELTPLCGVPLVPDTALVHPLTIQANEHFRTLNLHSQESEICLP